MFPLLKSTLHLFINAHVDKKIVFDQFFFGVNLSFGGKQYPKTYKQCLTENPLFFRSTGEKNSVRANGGQAVFIKPKGFEIF